MNYQLGKEIGRGGYGVVYECQNDGHVCIKKSFKTSDCRLWSNEYQKMKDLETNLGSKTNFGRVHLIVPSKFYESDNECFMEMPRIYNPVGFQTLHPLLGDSDCNYTNKNRGVFKGLKQLKNEVGLTDELLEEASYDLGVMMGYIHFIGKNDAYDVEIYLGGTDVCTKGGSGIYKLGFYIADFDLSEPIKKYDTETIYRMIWSLDAVPYFPSDGNLLELFKSGYMKASGSKYKDVAESILARYPG